MPCQGAPGGGTYRELVVGGELGQLIRWIIRFLGKLDLPLQPVERGDIQEGSSTAAGRVAPKPREPPNRPRASPPSSDILLLPWRLHLEAARKGSRADLKAVTSRRSAARCAPVPEGNPQD